MYIVVFRARMRQWDESYQRTAARLRQLALETYGCLEFCAVTQDGEEIALSYWTDPDAIARWKQQADHLLAQQSGRDTWYSDYRVEIARIERSYAFAR